MKPFALKNALEKLRETNPLIHCITNYVTVNDCANALLACGASPIMSDEPEDVEDITTICNALVLNIGTLNKHSIEGMHRAAARASELNHAIVLDPVGAGASKLRTNTAAELMRKYSVSVVRGNMSEIKALAAALDLNLESSAGCEAEQGVAQDASTAAEHGSAQDASTSAEHGDAQSSAQGASDAAAGAPSGGSTRGVDVAEEDIVRSDNLRASAQFACNFAREAGCVVAITGPVDIVANAAAAYAVSNGSALCARITGAGCMLSCTTAAYVAAKPDCVLEAVLAAVCAHGVCGDIAQARVCAGGCDVGGAGGGEVSGAKAGGGEVSGAKAGSGEVSGASAGTASMNAAGAAGALNPEFAPGSGSFRTYFIDALYNLRGDVLENRARTEKII